MSWGRVWPRCAICGAFVRQPRGDHPLRRTHRGCLKFKKTERKHYKNKKSGGGSVWVVAQAGIPTLGKGSK